MSRTHGTPGRASASAAANAPEARVDTLRAMLGLDLGARRSGPVPVPPSAGKPRPGLSHAILERRLVVNENAAPVGVEQYRRLAASLHQLQADRGLKTLMVTSSVPGEGKTLSVVNLALTLSETCHQRVLLIDADLRRPTVHEWFGLPNTVGLVDALGPNIMTPCVFGITERLSLVPAGQSSQSMADLTTARVATFLEESAKNYDWVLIDAPPIGVLPEAQLLARLTRAVLFVIAANSTPHSLVTRAIEELAPEWIVGTVLNRVEEQCIPSARYYYGYYASPGPRAETA